MRQHAVLLGATAQADQVGDGAAARGDQRGQHVLAEPPGLVFTADNEDQGVDTRLLFEPVGVAAQFEAERAEFVLNHLAEDHVVHRVQ